ncbi:MAG: helix-turn-helix domain-containing protein [Candidatus Methanomethyliaceae archaeon]|nr:helix-turn-helix domain-containing protein [Candidatus Methanomethyliaceae archaeon]MDW7970831.1 helix-turn-helix domain-containing protein [Nitrososphaerota archaeon]
MKRYGGDSIEEKSIVEELIDSLLISNEEFSSTLRSIMKRKNISLKELSQGCNIPISTLNKIISESRDLRISTLRAIINYFKSLESLSSDIVIGVIASRICLDTLSKHQIYVKDKKVLIKEYPVATIEDAIISAIRATRDGVHGIVCAPIVASIIEKFLKVPIVCIKVGEINVLESINLLVDKIISQKSS